MPYGLVVLPALDRVVSTNSSMHLDEEIFSGVTYQVWRLSDLKLLKTANLDVGPDHYAHISPEEPRLGPDGSVFVQTLGCGLERITGIDTSEPKSKLVYVFPGNWCGVQRSWATIWCRACRRYMGSSCSTSLTPLNPWKSRG